MTSKISLAKRLKFNVSAVLGTVSDVQRLIYVGMLLPIFWLPAIFGTSIISGTAALYPLAQSAHPYFQPGHVLLLYVALPIVVLSGFIFLMSPGFIWVLTLRGSRRWEEFFLLSFAATVILLVLSTSLVKMIAAPGYASQNFMFCVMGTFLLGWGALFQQILKGSVIHWPLSTAESRRRAWWMVGVVIAGVILLLPKLFWENFNGDGQEMFHLGASLNSFLTPTYSWDSQLRGADVKFILPMFIVNWSQHIFGVTEGAARLPFLLNLCLLFAIIVEIAERFSRKTLTVFEEAALWLALATFAVVMAYNASYNPWFADIAAPAAHDSLLPAMLLGAFFYFWQRKYALFVLFAALGYFVRPTTSLLLLSFAFFTLLLEKEQRWRRSAIVVAALSGSALLAMFLQSAVALPASEYSYSTGAMWERLRYINLFDFQRLDFLLFPAGILPAVSLLALKWQNTEMRILTLVTIAYFLFFYSMAFVALHHFVPAMIFPLAIFWYLYLTQKDRFRKRLLPLVLGAGILAFSLSLPHYFTIAYQEREVGLALQYRSADPAALPGGRAVELLFTPVWDVKAPSQEWGVEYNVIKYYARQPKPENQQIDYILQPPDDPPPAGFTLVNTRDDAAAYVRNPELWKRHQQPALPANYRSSLYDIPPQTLFPHLADKTGKQIIDLKYQWKKRILPYLTDQ